jgi:hypothetical protein
MALLLPVSHLQHRQGFECFKTEETLSTRPLQPPLLSTL